MRLYRGYVWLVVWSFIVINVGFRDITPVTRLTPCGFHVENWGVSAPATMILVLRLCNRHPSETGTRLCQ